MNSDTQQQLQMVTMQQTQEWQTPMAMALEMVPNTSVCSTNSRLCGAITQISMITSMFVAMQQDQLQMRHTFLLQVQIVEQTLPTLIQMAMECLMVGKLSIEDGLVLRSPVRITGQWTLTTLMMQIGMRTAMGSQICVSISGLLSRMQVYRAICQKATWKPRLRPHNGLNLTQTTLIQMEMAYLMDGRPEEHVLGMCQELESIP